jgi:hypothetical protein
MIIVLLVLVLLAGVVALVLVPKGRRSRFDAVEDRPAGRD